MGVGQAGGQLASTFTTASGSPISRRAVGGGWQTGLNRPSEDAGLLLDPERTPLSTAVVVRAARVPEVLPAEQRARRMFVTVRAEQVRDGPPAEVRHADHLNRRRVVDRVDGHDVGVLQACEPLGLASWTKSDLEGHRPAGKRFLMREEDSCECALSEFLHQMEAEKCVADAQADTGFFLIRSPIAVRDNRRSDEGAGVCTSACAVSGGQMIGTRTVIGPISLSSLGSASRVGAAAGACMVGA